jgi:predicted transcriptional regulator
VLKNNINNPSIMLQFPSFPDLTQIKEMREALDISLPKLEKHTGVKRSLLRKLESGESSTSYKNATAIFSYLVNAVNTTKKTVGVFSNHDIVSVIPSDTVEKARNIMNDNKFDVLPIITKNGALRGQISIFKINPKKIKDESKTTVEEVAEEAPVSVPHNIPVHWIRDFLQEPGSCVMITKGGKFIGIINLHHLITNS